MNPKSQDKCPISHPYPHPSPRYPRDHKDPRWIPSLNTSSYLPCPHPGTHVPQVPKGPQMNPNSQDKFLSPIPSPRYASWGGPLNPSEPYSNHMPFLTVFTIGNEQILYFCKTPPSNFQKKRLQPQRIEISVCCTTVFCILLPTNLTSE